MLYYQQIMENTGIIPVIKLENTADAVNLCKALRDGGVYCAEVTYRAEGADKVISQMTEAFPDMLIGAGTVLTVEQVDKAISAGAKFCVAPGLNAKVVKHCLDKGIPFVPGVSSPSQIEQAMELGLDFVKFFPAEQAGGLAYIKAISAPYFNVKFMPTGGINENNLNSYLSFNKIVCCGGSWIVPDKLVKEQKWEEIDKFIDRIISNSTPARPLWNVEQSNGGNSKWNYIDGCMLTALLRLSSIESNKVFEDFVINFLDYYVSSDGSIVGYDKESYNLDNINEGRVLFDVYKVTEDKKYDRAIELLHSQLLSQPRTQTGNFWHKKIYPNQIWLDGLYMAQVFATRYAFQHDKDYSDIVNQFKNVRKLMYNADKGLYYHCCDCSKSAFWANEKGLSANFWLRANGWYLIALVDCIEYCDDVSTKHILSEILVEALSGILQYKDNATNMFYQVIDCAGREGNYLETSGSCMISYALLTAARLGIIDSSLGLVGKQIFDGVVDKYFSNANGQFNLGGICLVAGLGPDNNKRRDGSYEYYISEPIVANDGKGIAPLVLHTQR